jgi:uncharacterized protein with LGFP repeats
LSAIDDKHSGLGGAGGWLGAAIDDEMDTSDGRGRARDFQNGSIYWSAAVGAWEVHGDIRIKWAQLGGVKGLGFPVTDERGKEDGRGRYNEFEHGSIYWTPQTGAHEIRRGPIRKKWAEMGREKSPLGYPTSDQRDVNGVVYNEFEGGSILLKDGQVEVRDRID